MVEAGPRQDTLAFQVDLWSARGELPGNLAEVVTRQKEIQYSSRTRANTDQFKQLQQLALRARELLAKLPDELRDSEEAKLLQLEADHKVYNIVHLIYRSKHYEGQSKDFEFSRRRWRSIGGPATTTRCARCAIPRCWSARATSTASSPSISPSTAANETRASPADRRRTA